MFDIKDINSIHSCEDGLQDIPFDVLNAFYSYEHFIILGHSKPDADCMTSQLAMFLALKKLQKKCQLVSAGPFTRPEIQNFAERFESAVDSKEFGQQKVLAIIVDCSTKERTGLAEQIQGLPLLVIDHHASGENDGDLQYCDPTAPSTSILVYNMLLQLPLFLFQMDPQKYGEYFLQAKYGAPTESGIKAESTTKVEGTKVSCKTKVKAESSAQGLQGLQSEQYSLVDQELANILFLGFATDTGFFRFLKPENAGSMLRLVANLVDTKINLQDIYQHMTGGRILGTRRILGLLLLRAGFLLEGRLCVSYQIIEDKKHWHVEGNDSDSFYALSLATQNCEAILLLDEAEKGLWNVGLRALKQHDVGTIAAKFGGGGHRNAAGCRIKAGELAEALEQLLGELCQLWNEDVASLPEIQDYIGSAPSYLVHEMT